MTTINPTLPQEWRKHIMREIQYTIKVSYIAH